MLFPLGHGPGPSESFQITRVHHSYCYRHLRLSYTDSVVKWATQEQYKRYVYGAVIPDSSRLSSTDKTMRGFNKQLEWIQFSTGLHEQADYKLTYLNLSTLHIAHFSSYGPDDGQRKNETCCPNELVKISYKLVSIWISCVWRLYQ
jgi:hypothetical protein